MARLREDNPRYIRERKKNSRPKPRITPKSPGLPGMNKVSAPTRKATRKNARVGRDVPPPRRISTMGTGAEHSMRQPPPPVQRALSRATVVNGRLQLKSKADLHALRQYNRDIQTAVHRTRLIVRANRRIAALERSRPKPQPERPYEFLNHLPFGIGSHGPVTYEDVVSTAANATGATDLARGLTSGMHLGRGGLRFNDEGSLLKGGALAAATILAPGVGSKIAGRTLEAVARDARAVRAVPQFVRNLRASPRLITDAAVQQAPSRAWHVALRAGIKAAPRVTARGGVGVLGGAVRYGPAGSLAAEATPGGSFHRALQGQGRLASILPKSISHGPLAVPLNALKDIVNLPANALPMVYLPAVAITHYLTTGDSGPIDALWKDWKAHDALGRLASLDFPGFLKAAEAHPVYTALELGGGYAAAGRGIGAVGRGLGRGGIEGSVFAMHQGSRAGIDLGGEMGLYERSLSPNTVTAVMQRARDLFVAPERQGRLTHFGETNKARYQARALQHYAATRENLIRHRTDAVERAAHAADLGAVANPAIGAVIEGFVSVDRFMGSLENRIMQLDKAASKMDPDTEAVPLADNRANANALREVQQHPAQYRDKLREARDTYVEMMKHLEDETVAAGLGDKMQFLRAKAKPALITGHEHIDVGPVDRPGPIDPKTGKRGPDVERDVLRHRITVAPNRPAVWTPETMSAYGVRYQTRATHGTAKPEGVTWTPGKFQRGQIEPDGTVNTWDPGRGIHEDMASAWRMQQIGNRMQTTGGLGRVDLDIGPNGDVYARYAGDKTEENRQAIIRIIQDANPEFRVADVGWAEKSNPWRDWIHFLDSGRPRPTDPIAMAKPNHGAPPAVPDAGGAGNAKAGFGHADAMARAVERDLPPEGEPREETTADNIGVPELKPQEIYEMLNAQHIHSYLWDLALKASDLGYISQKAHMPTGVEKRTNIQSNAVEKRARTGKTSIEGTSPRALRDIYNTPVRRIKALADWGFLNRAIRTVHGGKTYKSAEAALKSRENLGKNRTAFNLDAIERREVVQDAIHDGNLDAWDPEALDYIEQFGHDVWTEGTTEREGGNWVLLDQKHVKLIQDLVEKPVLFEGSWARVIGAWKRAVLTTTPNWYMGNFTQTSIAALANLLMPPPFGAIGERLGIGAVGRGKELVQIGGPEFAAGTVPGGLGETTQRPRSRLNTPAREDLNLSDAARAIAKVGTREGGDPRVLLNAWDHYVRGALTLNARLIEEPLFLQMLGKVAARDIRSQQAVWHRSLNIHREALEEFMQGKHEGPAQMALADRIFQETGNWHSMAPWEKKMKANFAPFYMWHRAALRFVFLTMPHNHPILTSILAGAANMTEDERRALGFDIVNATQNPAGAWLQGGIPTMKNGRPTPDGIKTAANISAFGMLSDYPGSVASAWFPFAGGLETLGGVDWKGQQYIDSNGKPLDQGTLVALAAYLSLEPFIPFQGIASKIMARGRKTQAPFVSYTGKPTQSYLDAVKNAFIPSPLPGSRTYAGIKDQVGRGSGGGGGGSAASPSAAPSGGGGQASPGGGGGQVTP